MNKVSLYFGIRPDMKAYFIYFCVQNNYLKNITTPSYRLPINLILPIKDINASLVNVRNKLNLYNSKLLMHLNISGGI